jgi:hypothetical protein
MTKRGATGTDEQLERVTRFFLEKLTLVNVNISAVEELAGVLGITHEVAQEIIAAAAPGFRQRRRTSRSPGMNPDALQERKSRIRFRPKAGTAADPPRRHYSHVALITYNGSARDFLIAEMPDTVVLGKQRTYRISAAELRVRIYRKASVRKRRSRIRSWERWGRLSVDKPIMKSAT